VLTNENTRAEIAKGGGGGVEKATSWSRLSIRFLFYFDKIDKKNFRSCSSVRRHARKIF
jgi:hypothetical protein